MAFKYQRRDASAWEKRANQTGSDFAGIIDADIKTFSPAKGDNFIRILSPTWDNPEHYGLDVYVHYSVGPDKASVLCLNKMKNERCPICEARQRAERAGDDELAGELKAGKRVLVWMINRKEESAGPMIWSMAWTLDKDFCAVARDRRTGEVYALDDPENGYDVSFERTGEGSRGTKYVGVQIARKPSPVDQAFIDYVAELPIPMTLIWRTYDELKSLYEGGAVADDAPPRDDRRRDEPRRDDPPPRDERRRDDPPPRDEPAQPSGRWRPPGGSGAAAPREEVPPRRDDPPPRDERDYGAAGSASDDRRRDEPSPSTSATGGKTKAQELREKFQNRTR